MHECSSYVTHLLIVSSADYMFTQDLHRCVRIHCQKLFSHVPLEEKQIKINCTSEVKMVALLTVSVAAGAMTGVEAMNSHTLEPSIVLAAASASLGLLLSFHFHKRTLPQSVPAARSSAR